MSLAGLCCGRQKATILSLISLLRGYLIEFDRALRPNRRSARPTGSAGSHISLRDRGNRHTAACAASGRSRRDCCPTNADTCRVFGLASGRHSYSPAAGQHHQPIRICTGRAIVVELPAWFIASKRYMLVSGAMPTCSRSRRGNIVISTSICVASPGLIVKR